MNHKIKESLMGHSGSIENEYGGHRNLMVSTVEALKKTYPLMMLNGHNQEGLAAKAEFELKVEELESEIASLNEFIKKTLSPLVGWAENQGYKIEDFSRISDETPSRWKVQKRGKKTLGEARDPEEG